MRDELQGDAPAHDGQAGDKVGEEAREGEAAGLKAWGLQAKEQEHQMKERELQLQQREKERELELQLQAKELPGSWCTSGDGFISGSYLR
eukprot:gene9201-1301_t